MSIKVVFYLPGYDSKVREEFEIEGKPSKEEIAGYRRQFLEDYGRKWKTGTIGRIKKGSIVQSYFRKGRKISQGVRSRSRWTGEQERYIKNNPGIKIKDIAFKFNKTYHSVRTKRQRLLGIRR